MSIEILSADRVRIVEEATGRDTAIRAAGTQLKAAGAVTDEYVAAMLRREQTVSTFMGNQLAIPHGTNDAKDEVLASALSVTRYEQPIDWAGEQVRFVIGIAGHGDSHLELLSGIAILFSEEESVDRLLAASSAAELHELLSGIGE